MNCSINTATLRCTYVHLLKNLLKLPHTTSTLIIKKVQERCQSFSINKIFVYELFALPVEYCNISYIFSVIVIYLYMVHTFLLPFCNRAIR